MNKPLIGINPYYFEHKDSYWNGTKERYFNAVWLGGGIPMTLHHPANGGSVEEIADRIDGLLIVGGPDIPSHIYGGEHPELLDEDVMQPKRETFDREVFLASKDMRKPILAICAGFQHINVIFGGTLYEDIPTQMERPIHHGDFNGKWTEHEVVLGESSLIQQVMGSRRINVTSTHHQGIRNLGKGLKVVGHAPDGLAEAIEYTEDPGMFIAVQWHPEAMLDSKENVRLFEWLATEANKRKKLGIDQ